MEAILSMDTGQVVAAMAGAEQRGVRELVTCACGEAPILAAIVAARALGATRAHAVSYANSGDTPLAEPDRVVGYGAIALTDGSPGRDASGLPQRVKPATGPLTGTDRTRLLALARDTLARYLTTGTLPLARGFSAESERARGVFVTLRKREALRGCIGQMQASDSTRLPLLVQRVTLAAALEDPRFDKVKANEVKDLTVEISLLTPFAKVKGPEDVRPGRDGVLLQKDGRTGVFLPQVATEEGWNRDQLLDNLCLKAGLAASCWHAGATLSTFQAEVFGEGKR